MEHRWSMRKPVAGSVTVDCPRAGTVYGSLRDVSLGGVFVDTGLIALSIHAPVVVTINTRSLGDWLYQRPIQAMVIRLAAEGAGLMFLEPEMDLIRSLRDFLYASVEPGLSPFRRAHARPEIGKRRDHSSR